MDSTRKVNLMPDLDTLIRKAGAADITLLSRLIRDSHQDVAGRFCLTPDNCPKHPSNCTDGWIEKDLIRGIVYYILEHKNIPVGCVAIEQSSTGVCFLERLSVLSEQRRRGFGRSLVNNALLNAKTLGAQEVGIGIIAQHTRLKVWYGKIGFSERETKDIPHLPFRVTLMSYVFGNNT
jgi:GNAT superfamily N-acetyltransferase